MNNAWEVTPEDVGIVLKEHGVEADYDQCDSLLSRMTDDGTYETIVENVLLYTEFEEQCESMMDDIENWLLQKGVIQGEKIYHTE